MIYILFSTENDITINIVHIYNVYMYLNLFKIVTS